MTPDVDVLLPVLGRPHRAVPFAKSLSASIEPERYRLTVIADVRRDTKTVAAWRAVLAEADRPQDQLLQIELPGTFARKINLGYRATSAPWLLMVGDDVLFEPGWLDEALRAAAETGALVVGTNDRGLDRQGLVAPHPIISRRYVDEQGASWDGPGVVCHEGYWHTAVDHEIALVARERGVWAYAPDAVIAHQHFLNRKAPQDATYRRGMARVHHDVGLLRRRRRGRTDLP